MAEGKNGLHTVKLDTQKEHKEAMLHLLEDMKQRVESGVVVRLGVIFEQRGNEWGTAFAVSEDNRLDAAMMIELALRRLGFGNKAEC